MERRDSILNVQEGVRRVLHGKDLKNIRKEPVAKVYLHNHNLITNLKTPKPKQQRTETRLTIKRIDPQSKNLFYILFLV